MLARFSSLLLTIMLLAPAGARAQSPEQAEPPPRPLTLDHAVDYALAHHPALRAQAALEDAASANLDIARSRYIPRGSVGLQENRATGNVVPGSQFEMGLPSISGPPRDRVFDSGVWGSVAGLTVSWDIAHLTQQMTIADAALADQRGSRAAADAQALSVAFGAADAFAAAVEAGEEVKAARAGVEREGTFETVVDALVRSGLRPGADAARAAAETAAARTQLVRDEERKALSETRLAEALGAAGQPIQLAPGRLVAETPAQQARSPISVRNPFLIAADESVRGAQKRERAAALEYLPRVEIAAALWGRGDGLFAGGANLGFAQGAVPDTPNWAGGIVATIPILEYPEIRARARLAASETRLARAHRDEVVQQVLTQLDSADAILRSVYEAAKQTRVELQSGRAAVDQAQARYRAGLYTVEPVAEALRLLAQAEADDAVARVEIWRARSLVARAVGDLGPLLKDVREAGAQGR